VRRREPRLAQIGHLLGLGHSAAPSDVMSPYYAAEKVTLSANDKERIAKLVAAAA
jgi:predicted Zn-dependent protease